MFHKGYAILDTKSGLHSMPFFTNADAVAIRMVYDTALDGATLIAKHPSDFVLYKIGEYDDNTSMYVSLPPINLGTVSSIIAQVSNRTHAGPKSDFIVPLQKSAS